LFTDKITGEEAGISEFLAIFYKSRGCFGQFSFSHLQGNVLLERTKVFVAAK